MNKQVIEKVCSEVYKKFPEYEGIQPEIKTQPNDTHLLIFQTIGEIANQKSIQLRIRVLVDGRGDIVKITSSR
jgi:hypothetical protein